MNMWDTCCTDGAHRYLMYSMSRRGRQKLSGKRNIFGQHSGEQYIYVLYRRSSLDYKAQKSGWSFRWTDRGRQKRFQWRKVFCLFFLYLKQGNIQKWVFSYFINYVKQRIMFYYKILVWLFWVVLSFITGCVPLILLILLVGLWDIEEANKPR